MTETRTAGVFLHANVDAASADRADGSDLIQMNNTNTQRLVIRRWVNDPLEAEGFRPHASKRWEYALTDEVTTVIELRTRRDTEAVRFTLEWGFYSAHFAAALGYPSKVDLLSAPVRGPIGTLIGDGRFDVWWAIYPQGRILKEWSNMSKVVTIDDYTELTSTLTDRLVPLSRQVCDSKSLVRSIPKLLSDGLLNSYFADPARTINILSGSAPHAKELVTKAGSQGAEGNYVVQRTAPLVDVEWNTDQDNWLVTFDDEVAHSHEDLVQKCLDYSRAFPGVESVTWPDRELIVLAGSGIDAATLKRALRAIVDKGIDQRETDG